ncbi:VCBS domain-containing protein [Vibrio chagasii]|nr:VCBS domain-containing protein [Vibrio chagasii]
MERWGGTLTISDDDAGEATFTAQTTGHGRSAQAMLFNIGTDGAWDVRLNNDLADAVQELGDGDTLTETFTVTSAETAEHDITVTITAVQRCAGHLNGDGGDAGGSDDGRHQLEHGRHTDDRDDDAAKGPRGAKFDTAGPYGTFNIGTDGVWTYSE